MFQQSSYRNRSDGTGTWTVSGGLQARVGASILPFPDEVVGVAAGAGAGRGGAGGWSSSWSQSSRRLQQQLVAVGGKEQ
ncbi:hypothetical protein CDL15_Pgr013279 [Punica granatum]|uniref:Uncharacterized protein n=1 Tax=Punica granatum TaxID=22663 RepID=A0A218WNL2_PUNGR|nr:hypothetical protein CDL15_Pgr013279 [Punica granatum]